MNEKKWQIYSYYIRQRLKDDNILQQFLVEHPDIYAGDTPTYSLDSPSFSNVHKGFSEQSDIFDFTTKLYHDIWLEIGYHSYNIQTKDK